MANRASAKSGQTDWEALDRRSDQQVEDGAASDPDNPPLTAEDFDTLRQVPKVRIIRMKLGMTQEAFAEAFGLSLATVRDWEQGRSRPDQSAQSFLRVIESIPDQVRTALQEA